MMAGFSPQLELLVQGLCLFALLCFSTMILSKSGRSPYYAVLMIVPYVAIIALWVFAFTAWPKRDKK